MTSIETILKLSSVSPPGEKNGGAGLNALLDMIACGVVMAEKASGGIVYANSRALEFYGVKSAEALGLAVSGAQVRFFTHGGQEYPCEQLPLQRALSTGETVHGEELAIQRPDGSRITVRAGARALLDETGKITAALQTLENITAQKKAEGKMAWLASFPELNPNPVAEADADGRLAYLNPAGQRLFPGWDTPGFEHTWLSGLGTARAELSAGKETSILREIEVNGEWYQQSVCLAAQPERLRIYARNITDRKRTQENLIERLAELSAIYTAAPLMLLVVDEECRVRSANRFTERFTGVSSAELAGQPAGKVLCCLHALDDPGGCGFGPHCAQCPVRASITETIKTGRRHLHLETSRPVAAKDGGARELTLLLSTARLSVLGRPHALVTLLDITARKQAEAALRLSEERYRTLFSGMTEGFALHKIIRDEKGRPCDYRFLDINPAFERLTGLKRGDIIGRTCGEALPGEQALWTQFYGEAALTGNSAHFTEYSPALDKHFEIYSYSPCPEQVAAVFTDITERKKKESELRKITKMLRALSNSGQALMRAEDEAGYMEEVCRIVVHDCGHAMVWIGFAEDDSAKTVRPVAHYGFDEGYLSRLNITWADTERGRGPTGASIRTGKPVFCGNMRTDPRIAPWRQEAVGRGYAASVSFPLMHNGRAFGALTIYSKETDPFTDDEAKLLGELACDLSYGITSLRLRAAHERSLAALKESEERYRVLTESAPDAVIVFRDGRFLYANSAALRLYGVGAPEQLPSKRVLDWVHPDDRPAMSARMKQAAKTGKLPLWESRIVRRSGQVVFVEGVGGIINYQGGRSAQVILRDVSERKRIEETLRQTHDYLEKLITYANAPIICWDSALKITRFNRAFERLTNYKRQEVLGKALTMLFPKGERKESLGTIRRALGVKNWDGVEIPVCCKDGATRLMLWNSADIYANDGKTLLATIAQGQDITERKKAEAVLKRDKEIFEWLVREKTKDVLRIQSELEKARRLSDIGTLAATVAHELRNPLAAISMAASNIKRKAENPLLEKHLVNIRKKVAESDQIISNLLFYSRLRPPHIENANLRAILEECAANAQAQSKKTISLKKKLAPLKSISIEADALQLREIFQNILNNACDAVADSGGRVEIAAGVSGGLVKISVADNGSGIEKDLLEKVFDPFFTTKAKGTGLGLSVCRQLISMHNGTIELKSKPGKGTAATVVLPVEHTSRTETAGDEMSAPL
ncbi:MAG: PAS domain S-box protein [Elusimicrobiales bacterium]|nr:PAS domain S-box protein [Elusimicrobiales bacterium]